MKQINIHEAKTHFSKLIQEVLQGKEIVIAKAGKPIVKLTVYSEVPPKRRGGQLHSVLTVAEDFNDPLPDDILAQFYSDDDQ